MGKQISISNSLKTILPIMGVVGGIYAFTRFIDFRIEHAVNNEQFIKKVASHVRPYVIFDEDGAIHVDGGAMQCLEEIEVEQTVKEGRLKHLKFIVTPKSYLANAPLLEIYSLITFYTTNRRGSGHQWVYELTPAASISGPDNIKEVHRFRLEILR